MPQLAIDISARLATFQDSLDKIGRQGEQVAGRLNRAFDGLRATIAGIGGGLTVGAFANFLRSGVEAADSLDDLSQKVGISVEKLSELKFLLDVEGISTEQFQQGIKALADSLVKANDATSKEATLLRALGVSATEPYEALRQLADAFAALPDGATKSTVAVDLLGKAGLDLIPALNGGAAAIDRAGEAARKLGLIFTAETASKAAEFKDNVTKLRLGAEALSVALTENLVRSLASTTTELVKAREEGRVFETVFDNMRRSVNRLFSDLAKGDPGFLKNLFSGQAGIDKAEEMARRTSTGKIDTGIFGPPEPADIRSRQLEERIRKLLADRSSGAQQAGGPDQGEAFIESLRKRLVVLEEDEYALLRLEANQKKVLAAAEPLISAIQRETEFRRQHTEAVARDAAAVEAEQQRRFALVDGVAKYVEGLEEETSLLGLSNEKRLVAVQLLRLEQAGIAKASEEYAAASERIQAAVNAAAGAQLTQEMRTPLESMNAEMQRYRDLLGSGAISTETFNRATERLAENFKKTAEEGKGVEDVAKSIGLTFSSAFEDAVSGGKSLRDILRGIEQDLLRLGTRKLITEPAMKWFEGFLGNLGRGSNSSSSVNYENSFDRPSGGGGGGGGGGIVSFFGDILKNIFTRADGGPVDAGRGYVVGERGPEWFVPRQSGTIVPSGAGPGGMTVVNNFKIEGGPITRQSESQIAAAALRGLERGRRNL